MGGAQAVAALAFGTETIPKVEKITGPGNIFVTLAKKAVYGHVDIDVTKNSLVVPGNNVVTREQKYLCNPCQKGCLWSRRYRYAGRAQ